MPPRTLIAEELREFLDYCQYHEDPNGPFAARFVLERRHLPYQTITDGLHGWNLPYHANALKDIAEGRFVPF